MAVYKDYIPGDYFVQCDRTGMKRLRSECRKEWNGLIVAKEVYEPRHPQDFLKAREDRLSVKDPRPKADHYFLSTNEVKASEL